MTLGFQVLSFTTARWLVLGPSFRVRALSMVL